MRTVFDKLAAVRWLTDPLAIDFMQRALLATLLLAVAAGLLGTWIVLRRLAFFAHAAGTATFPGLVVAGPWGIAAPLAALGAGLGFAGLLSRMTRRGATSADAATGLLLTAALALGVILASDVYRAERRRRPPAVRHAARARRRRHRARRRRRGRGAAGDGRARAHLAGDRLRPGRRARARRARRRTAIGSCSRCWRSPSSRCCRRSARCSSPRCSSCPAATARLLTGSLRGLLAAAVAIAACEGVGGLLLAYHLDLPPGPAIAVIGGGAFALVALAGSMRRSVAR